MRKCTKCNDVKPDSEFYTDKRAISGFRSDCKVCARASNADRFKRNGKKYTAAAKLRVQSDPERFKADRRRYKLKSLYGITPNEYDQLLASQAGVCAICKSAERLKHGVLAVDHDHGTGEVRGLLCFNCNASLGKLEEHLDSLLDYLKVDRVRSLV